MASSKSIQPLNTTILHSVPHFLTVNLTIDNYLILKAQVILFLKGHHLLGFVDDSLPPPFPLLENEPNLEYTWWLQQDQLLLSTIKFSFSKNVLAQVLVAQPPMRVGLLFKHCLWPNSMPR